MGNHSDNGSSHSSTPSSDDHKSSPSQTPTGQSQRHRNSDSNIANVRDIECMNKSSNNGNDIENENDNDRKEGDYETYPFPYQQPERHRKDSSERSLILTSQKSAGSVDSNHSVTGVTTSTAMSKNTTVKSEDLPCNDLKNKKNNNNNHDDDDDTPNSPI